MGQIRVKKLHPEAKLPARREGDIGWDLFACTVEPLNETLLKVGTGIAVELPAGYWAQIENRSSMGKNGFDAHGGIVDNIYRGEIMIVLARHGASTPASVKPGDKVAQLIIRRQEDTGWSVLEVSTLSDTERGSHGFGSTGR